MATPLDKQVGGSHYKTMKIQPIEFCQANELNACESNIVKYACRHKQKGRKKDLEKVIHYAELLIEMEYSSKSTPKVEDEKTLLLGDPYVETGSCGVPFEPVQSPSSPQLELPLTQEEYSRPTPGYQSPYQWYADLSYLMKR